MPQTAIIVGASSGIGEALARQLDRNNWRVIATGRRVERLEHISRDCSSRFTCRSMDVRRIEPTLHLIDELFLNFAPIDLVIINSGVGSTNPELLRTSDEEMIDTNARSFALIAAHVNKHFLAQGRGHLVGNTSIAGLRGGPAVAYAASKAFASNYLEGLRLRSIADKNGIHVTDIRPGFVDTEMIDKSKAFWVASPEKAARQILRAIARRKGVAYITRRWALIAFLLKTLPAGALARLR
ncbi:SDR family NAD(P)-dependent oxidoreductase [Pelagicoccus sp. SDUM812003]|uniref:SDR family NAD(P)-dependent oxidoreductase n=1 Tax=Pelagicoccus sp. SDUM812003 TaxID=3041267 RepID=UPI00280C688B|nr:SDR family NAD(P)-dependent oxidoreductase [Pelagicoccus sp. SDUM812003]MDQ8204088.1 SDR family NAD(P)-dependent oxidoreductase [Pelagicoccus sp. SDUM812003]